MKGDANENYAGTIDIKSPGETGHIITLLMVFMLSYGIRHDVDQCLVFNGYLILGDHLIKSE